MKNRCKNAKCGDDNKTCRKFIEKPLGRRFNNNITMRRRRRDDNDDDGLEPFPV